MIYTVRRGDTLYGIAKKQGITLHQLLQLNPAIVDPNKIYVGDKIIIKKGKVESDFGGVVDFYLQRGWRITSDYGIRRDPFSGVNTFHRGVDFGGKPKGEPIYTPIDGKVAYASSYSGWGNLIGVEDKNGFIHIFAHLDKLLKSVGDNVKRGDVVGLNGSTGNSTGSHLHYQINTPRGGIVGVNAHTDPKFYYDC
ncbi:peptidoglycan DD-metalloendopeptidase family protein [Alkalicella caledoniensis]|uniref:Peptidoglycan DD-metalloendopeptidase family protein n=1 Tax=Alkalicella caledoniensis TaxID=2731377 RepID=A0A7G9WBD4_ALKCA|nr:peptidoglycan DD-metalloendopeptidase family protein [Alkalicella caledoniensis]QNO15996.1 peptidoglycan DD-metalloendopeptidase family protein [Alkalicella caledoniensis]